MDISFIYDRVRMPGNIGTMIRNGDLLIDNNSQVRHIIISPENDHHISWYKSWIMNIIGWICDFFNLNRRISLNNNFGPDNKFNSKARRDIKRFACLSKNGYYSKLIFDPPDLKSLLEDTVVIILDNSSNATDISDLKTILLDYPEDTNFAFVIGGESTGISDEMLSIADHMITIPTRKGISINVSNAQGILCYELNRVFR